MKQIWEEIQQYVNVKILVLTLFFVALLFCIAIFAAYTLHINTLAEEAPEHDDYLECFLKEQTQTNFTH